MYGVKNFYQSPKIDDEGDSRKSLENRLRRGYSALKDVWLGVGKKETNGLNLNIEGIFLKVHAAKSSIYLTLPSLIDSNLTQFVERFQLNSTIVLSGELIENVLQKCDSPDRLPVSNGHAFLKIEESLESAAANMAKHWQAACLFRKESLLVIWSGEFTELSPWALEVEEFLRQVVSPSLGVPRVYIDKDGAECVELSVPNDTGYGDDEKNTERLPVYDAAIVMGLSVMCVLIVLIGVLAKELALKSLRDGRWVHMAWISLFPLIAFWIFPIFHWAIFTVTQIAEAWLDKRESLPAYSGKLASLSTAYESGFALPRITLIVPVYKESLQGILVPTIHNLLRAVAHYEMRGGTANIIVCDDGMQLIGEKERSERTTFYADHHIGWTARPKNEYSGYRRRGKFKKASNLNTCIHVCQLVEEKMLETQTAQQLDPMTEDVILEQPWLYEDALQEVLSESGGMYWSEGNLRIGSHILLMDSESKMPRDALIYAAAELHLTPEIGLLYCVPRIMQIIDSKIENWAAFMDIADVLRIAFNARLGHVLEIPGSCVFLRFNALREISYIDDEFEKVFSEATVTPEIDLSLRLQAAGYTIRASIIASRCNEWFRKGVSLNLWDYLRFLKKKAYGWCEVCFNPIHTWIDRSPFTPLLRTALWSSVPVAEKLWLIQRCGSYIVFGSALPLLLGTYLYLGEGSSVFPWPIATYYLICLYFLASLLLMSLLGDCFVALRFGSDSTKSEILDEHLKQIVLTVLCSLGTSAYVLNTCLRFFLCLNMTWGPTPKEFELTNTFIQLPKLVRYRRGIFSLLLCLVLLIIILRFAAPDLSSIKSGLAIAPLSIWVIAHFAVLTCGLGSRF